MASDDSTDTCAYGLLWGVGAGVRTAELDADHEPLLADLEDVGKGRDLGAESGAQGGDLGGQTGERLLALEEIERSKGRGTAEGVAAKTVAVKEGQTLLRQTKELTEDLVGGHGCCDGEVSST